MRNVAMLDFQPIILKDIFILVVYLIGLFIGKIWECVAQLINVIPLVGNGHFGHLGFCQQIVIAVADVALATERIAILQLNCDRDRIGFSGLEPRFGVHWIPVYCPLDIFHRHMIHRHDVLHCCRSGGVPRIFQEQADIANISATGILGPLGLHTIPVAVGILHRLIIGKLDIRSRDIPSQKRFAVFGVQPGEHGSLIGIAVSVSELAAVQVGDNGFIGVKISIAACCGQQVSHIVIHDIDNTLPALIITRAECAGENFIYSF